MRASLYEKTMRSRRLQREIHAYVSEREDVNELNYFGDNLSALDLVVKLAL